MATCNRQNMTLVRDALLSGEYPQGQSALRKETPSGSTWCCAGVACDKAAAAGVGTWAEGGEFTDADTALANTPSWWVTRSFSVMTRGVIRWLGIDGAERHPQLLPVGVNKLGTEMNDGGESFTAIAEAITEWYELDAPEVSA